MGNVLGEILDRDAGLGTADIGLREHQLVEGDVARWRQLDLLNGLCHVSFSENGRPRPSLDLQPAHGPARPPSSSLARTESQSRQQASRSVAEQEFALEQDVAANGHAEGKLQRLHLVEDEGPELGFAVVGKAEQRIAVLIKLGRKPGADTERIEELDHGNVIETAIMPPSSRLRVQRRTTGRPPGSRGCNLRLCWSASPPARSLDYPREHFQPRADVIGMPHGWNNAERRA